MTASAAMSSASSPSPVPRMMPDRGRARPLRANRPRRLPGSGRRVASSVVSGQVTVRRESEIEYETRSYESAIRVSPLIRRDRLPWPSTSRRSTTTPRPRYKKAQTPEDKLAALKEMWVILPKHKASEKVQADLKTKISELTDQIEHAKTGPKKAAPGTFKFPRQGAGQVVFLGPPNAGQVAAAVEADEGDARGRAVPVHDARAGPGDDGLRGRPRPAHRPAADHRRPLRALHHRHHPGRRRGAAVPRPRRRRRPGRDAGRDRPAEARPPRTRPARQSARPTTRRFTRCRRSSSRTRATTRPPDIRLEIAREVVRHALSRCTSSRPSAATGWTNFGRRSTTLLGVMRIYTKQPGKPADMTSPFTPPIGSTVAEFAGKVHRDLEDAVKSARVWGSGASRRPDRRPRPRPARQGRGRVAHVNARFAIRGCADRLRWYNRGRSAVSAAKLPGRFVAT